MAEDPATRPARGSERMDVVLTIVLALSAVATAWAGFQASAWGGEQSAALARSGALRAQAERSASTADTQRTLDVLGFLDWTSAMAEEIAADPERRPTTSYEPAPGTRSGFLYERFREEFVVAFDAWVATGPLVDDEAPRTPFEMSEYELASQVEADALTEQAQTAATEAAAASDRSSAYVLMGVLFALVLFFASVGSKAHGRQRTILLVCTVTAFVVALGVLLSRPVVF